MGLIKTAQPALHGDQHCPDGSDPIPCLITPPADAATYPEAVLAHPCLAHYWPADEPSGNLIDRKGSWDMTIDTHTISSTTYPQYGAAGPFTELPDLTAIVNAGTYGVTGHDGRFLNNFGSASFWTGAAPFTVEVWVYLTSYGSPGHGTIVQAANLTIEYFSHKLRGVRGAVVLADPADLPLNAWQHIVLRFDGTTMSLWRNGSLIDSNTAGSVNVTTTLSWLNNYTGPSWAPINGRSAQLAVYDCALTDAEITGHYDLRDTGTTAAGGLVLQTDGDGGTTWAQVGPDSLEDTTVSPGTYGDSTHVGQFTVDADGRLTAAANVAVTSGGGSPTGTAGGALDGTYPNPGIAASVAGAGLAETSNVLSVNVDNSTVEISSDTLRVKADGITANEIAANAVGSSELAATTVAAGSYGDSTHVATFTVDADGRLTAASNVSLTASLQWEDV